MRRGGGTYLLGAECLGSEVVAARFEASLNETGVEFEEILHLFLLDDAGHCLLFRRGEAGDWWYSIVVHDELPDDWITGRNKLSVR